MDRKKVDRIVELYLKDLSKKIKIDKVILFGSSANGMITEDSDIDLLVLSSSFEKMSPDDRFDLLYSSRKHQETQETPMDVFGLSLSEYDQASSLSVIGEIKETGREFKRF